MTFKEDLDKLNTVDELLYYGNKYISFSLEYNPWFITIQFFSPNKDKKINIESLRGLVLFALKSWKHKLLNIELDEEGYLSMSLTLDNFHTFLYLKFIEDYKAVHTLTRGDSEGVTWSSLTNDVGKISAVINGMFDYEY